MNFKYLLSTVLLSTIILGSHAQGSMDTLYANEHFNVALIFPSPIQKAVTGHSGFVFTYNREREGQMGLLKAVPGQQSNLLVITRDGSIFHFLLAYEKRIPRYSHFVDVSTRIGALGQKRDSLGSQNRVEPGGMKGLDYDILCSRLSGSPKGRLQTTRAQGLRLRLKQMVYHLDATYMVVELRNRSSIDFELANLDIFHLLGTQQKKSVYQEKRVPIIHRYNLPKLIKCDEMVQFVLVSPKFVLGKGERLKIMLREQHGNRFLELIK